MKSKKLILIVAALMGTCLIGTATAETFTFNATVDQNFLNPTNWSGSLGGTATPAAMAVGDTYVVANDATLSGAATLSGSLNISSGVTLSIAAAGSLVQNGGSHVTVANTGILSNAGSYTLNSTGTSGDPTTLICGGSGGFVNEAGATFTRTGGGFSTLDGRFTNHGTFTEVSSINANDAVWTAPTFVNATNGTATLRTSATASFTVNNAGTMTIEQPLDENFTPIAQSIGWVHVSNSGTFNAPLGISDGYAQDCSLSNTTTNGIVNVAIYLTGLDNSGVVNLTGDTSFEEDGFGDGFINRAGGIINQGTHKVQLANGVGGSSSPSTLINKGTWTGSGEITFPSHLVGLVIGSGGTLTNDGSWTYTGTSNSISVGGTLAGSAALNLPADAALNLTGGQFATATTTAGKVSVSANSILSGSLTLEQADMSGAGTLTVTGILGTGSGSNNVSCPLVLNNGAGQVLDVAAGTMLHQTGALDWTAGDVLDDGTWEHGQNPLEVPTGTTLGGGGTAVGDVAVQTAAEIAPGSSPGTFTIAGNLSNGGIYQCDVNGTNADQLVVTTHLDLTNSTLDFNVLSNGVTGNPYVIATYGTLSGAFATISNLPVGMSLNYAYDDGVSSNHIALVNGIAPSLLHWPLEAGRGTNITEAISGKTNVAFLTGPVVWTNGLAPDSSNAISVAIDTPPSYVDAGTLTTNDTYVAGSDPGYRVLSNNWSITAWVRLRNPQGATGDRVIASSVFDSNDGWLFLVNGFYAPDDLAFDFGSDRSYSGLRLPLNQAVFVAILADSSAVAFGSSTNRHRFAVWNGSTWHYSDGTQFINIRLEGLALGAFNSGQRQFDGVIDDVRIYNRTLTQAELDFLAGRPPTLMIAPAGPKLAKVSWTPAATNWVLQESTSLSPAAWTNSPSAFTNPIVVPATVPAKFYRLFKP